MLYALGMIVIGLAAGTASGAFGIGGAILIIPVLVYLVGMEQKIAQGTTLLLMLPPIGLLAALEYLRRGQADWQAAVWICVGFLVGGYIGAKLIAGLSPILLKRTFGVLLFLVGLKMILRP
ncbi:sulfite exporter TauE/SafE family protein [bacterium]|nr:sulfite exporter TauE/SafE family protein [bacterium]